jgi:hypothetical protein
MAKFVINGVVVQGLGAATNTLALQIPLIEKEFPEIGCCQRGSINIQLKNALRIEKPDHTTGLIPWAGPPGEIFSFLRILLECPVGATPTRAWTYIPHDSPHRNNRCQVEVIAEPIQNLAYGSQCRIHIERGRDDFDMIVV